jgi:hypothetical protein
MFSPEMWRISSSQSNKIEIELKKAPVHRLGLFSFEQKKSHNPFRKTILAATHLE